MTWTPKLLLQHIITAILGNWNVGSKFDGWTEVTKEMNKRFSSSMDFWVQIVIYVHPIHLIKCPSVRLSDLIFEVAHEETSLCRDLLVPIATPQIWSQHYPLHSNELRVSTSSGDSADDRANSPAPKKKTTEVLSSYQNVGKMCHENRQPKGQRRSIAQEELSRF